MTYEFENKDELTFIECSDEEKLKIIKAVHEDRCDYFDRYPRCWCKKYSGKICFDDVYRTLKPAPTPNQIDWAQVPTYFRYLYVTRGGEARLCERGPIERMDPPSLIYSGYGAVKCIHQGEYGFKRGTVESIDSLLVRPLGE